jgi:hypothetical protein
MLILISRKMKKLGFDIFWYLVASAVVVFFIIAFVLAELLKMIPVNI